MTSPDAQRTLVVEPTLLVRLKRPEGYEDVHPDLVLEDANIDPAFEPEIVANALPDDVALLLKEAAKALLLVRTFMPRDGAKLHDIWMRCDRSYESLRQRLEGSNW